jgi:hypothetical protein
MPEVRWEKMALNIRLWVGLDSRPFGQLQSVLHINARMANGAINLCVTKENLNGAEIADHPLPYKTGILACPHVSHAIVAAPGR